MRVNEPSNSASAAAPPSRSTVKAAAEEAGIDPALAEQARIDPALPNPPALPAEMPKRQQEALLQRWLGGVQSLVRTSLFERVHRDHRESNEAFLRRRIVAAITLVVGGTLLGISLAGVAPGVPLFYYLTFGLAATWVIGSSPAAVWNRRVAWVEAMPPSKMAGVVRSSASTGEA